MKKQSCVLRNTDDLMKKIWVNLVRDFRVSLQDPTFLRRHEQCLKSGVASYRREPFPAKMGAPVYMFKCLYQMENLFKRYSFKSDLYASEELDAACKRDFLQFQADISVPKPVTPLLHMVLQEARKINKRVLGQYDLEEHYSYCRFGKRAANGVPYSDSYLDVKLGRVTGSKAHISWFKEYLKTDEGLQSAIAECRKIRSSAFPEIGTLKLALVPKSFKSRRSIIPNSVIGSFHSYGLGRLVEERLKKNARLNIRTLQQKHGVFAKQASKHKRWVTGDLSKASDGPDVALMNRLLPRSWFNQFKLGRINQVEIDGERTYMHSFMAMGIGFTFTLETLVFYSLLKSISNLTGIRGKISVYGDDLIYPREMHRFVKPIFEGLGIIMNNDKTFVDSNFRESCGSDFFHGVDVRPFQPEMEGGSLRARDYVVFCYKLLNGLLLRWDKVEIPLTFHFLLREIAATDGQVFRVPLDFPDTAGYKVADLSTEWYIPWDPILWNTDLQCTSFRYYRQCADYRYVEFISPYFWESMRTASKQEAPDLFEDATDSSVVKWVRPRREKKNRRYISQHHKTQFLELVAAVSSKSGSKVLIQESTTTSWHRGLRT